jgi:hypothetical protein
LSGGLNAGIGVRMSKFHWFGDSWVVGSELEIQVPLDIVHTCTFAKLVSDYFNAECVNLGQEGISNDLLPLILFENIDNIDTQNDIVFFCLTSHHRVSMLDDKRNPVTVLPSIQDNSRRSNEHPHWKEWYKYFDNEYNQIFNYDRTVNLLSLWCKSRGIRFYFVNLFTTVTGSIFDFTESVHWLLPKNQSLSSFIFPVTDVEFGGMVLEDRAWMTNEQWDSQQQAINKYIKPCFCHPNIAGHKKIASEIIKIMSNTPHQ